MKMELARELTNLAGFEDKFTNMMNRLAVILGGNHEHLLQEYTSKVAAGISEAHAKAYSEHFSEEELRELVEIYKNPAFDRMRNTESDIMKSIHEHAMPILKQAEKELNEKVKQEMQQLDMPFVVPPKNSKLLN